MQSAQLATSTLTELAIGLPPSRVSGTAGRSDAPRGASGERPVASAEPPRAPLARGRPEPPPRTLLEARPRRGDCRIDIRRAAARHRGDRTAIDRAQVLEHAPVGR